MGFEYTKLSGLEEKTLEQRQILCNAGNIKEAEENTDIYSSITTEIQNTDDLSEQEKTLYITKILGPAEIVYAITFPNLKTDLLTLYEALASQAVVYNALVQIANSYNNGTSEYSLAQAVKDINYSIGLGANLSSLVFKDLLGLTNAADLSATLFKNAKNVMSTMSNIYNNIENFGSAFENISFSGNFFGDSIAILNGLDSTLGQVESILKNLDSMLDSLNDIYETAKDLFDELYKNIKDFDLDNITSLFSLDTIAKLGNLKIVQDICNLPIRLGLQLANIKKTILNIQLPKNLAGVIALISTIRNIVSMLRACVNMVEEVYNSIMTIYNLIASGNYLAALGMIAKNGNKFKIRPKIPPLKVEYPYNRASTSKNGNIKINLNEKKDNGQAKIEVGTKGDTYVCIDEVGDIYANAKRDIQLKAKRDLELVAEEKLKIFSDDTVDIEAENINITAGGVLQLSGSQIILSADVGVGICSASKQDIQWFDTTANGGVSPSVTGIATGDLSTTGPLLIRSNTSILMSAPQITIAGEGNMTLGGASLFIAFGKEVHTVCFTSFAGTVNFL